MTVFFDPNLRPPLWKSPADMRDTLLAFAREADVVLPGLAEGRFLTGETAPEAIAEAFLKMGARAAVVKTGPGGAYAATRSESFFCPAYRVDRIVDTVGAGDGFAAGVISALGEELPPGRRCGGVTPSVRSSSVSLATTKACRTGRHWPCLSGITGSGKRRNLMEALFEQLRRLRLLPVVRLEEAAAALPLAEALAAGGLPAAEITFRTPAAADAIRLIAGRMPAVCILAGTVLTVEQARAAVEAGARGIVSPGTNPDVVAWCMNHGVPVIPGCATPSEVEACIRMGLDIVSSFPPKCSAGWPCCGRWRGRMGRCGSCRPAGSGSGIWPPI